MRPTDTHFVARTRSVIAALCICFSLSAQDFSADRELFDAYKREDMAVWKAYVDSLSLLHSFTPSLLIYEYGYCGFLVDKDKANALPYIQRFHEHVETLKDQLPPGHYEMWISAVYVYEMAMHVSLRPVTTMNLAKEAARLAPNDPLTLSYYGTCLFYAPKAFGSKKKALQWFEKASIYFADPKWEYCWLREANEMYKHTCLKYFER